METNEKLDVLPLTGHIPEKLRLRLLEHFMSVLFEHADMGQALEYLRGDHLGVASTFTYEEHNPLMSDLLKPFDYAGFAHKNDPFGEMLKRFIPSLLKEAGAKSVSIEWE